MRQRVEAQEIQRQRQQGHGRPIISTEIHGTRLVTVGNRLALAKNCQTFHDFLHKYILAALDKEWCEAEARKLPADMHPIMYWRWVFFQQVNGLAKRENGIKTGPMSGAAALFFHLAYGLYTLAHNAELQSELLRRLKNTATFNGARHEVFVAASFVRAGFDIEFEDESDRSSTHCEFTATFKKTGRKFSVEAKRREGRNRERFGHLINNALAKCANHERVIFLEMNWEDPARGLEPPPFHDFILRRLRRMELNLQLASQPPAYIFVTNNPHEFDLEGPHARCSATCEGFKIPTFKGGLRGTLREAIDARENHIEMHSLIESMTEHSNIPATFDGDLPEALAGQLENRILVGASYIVPDGKGGECEAIVEDVVVNEPEKNAQCIALLTNGMRAIFTIPMSDVELEVWRKYPDTFFGVSKQRKTRADTPMALYDFFFETQLQVDRAKLLEAMGAAPNFDELLQLDHRRLASIRAEWMVNSVWNE
jgi:hypothetical protein